MGHYGSTKETDALGSVDYQPSVFSQYKTHCAATRINTDLAVTEAIRASHPRCHATSVSTRSCDLLGYAKAGHGTATLQTEGDDFLGQRTYSPPKTRLENSPGQLGDKVTFGLFNAKIDSNDIQFYVAEWEHEMYGIVKTTYLLTSKHEVDSAGHSRTADSLLMAAGKWSSELHDEIYVFDAGMWTKNSELWGAVQSASWDDVILDPAMKDTLISDVQNFFNSRKVYEEYAVPWKRGIILHGVPGCGKTISIKALMNSLYKRDQPVASLYVKSFDACQGMQYSIRSIFSQARVMAPCLLIFEDLDSLVVDEVRSYFLNEVDGLEDNNGILMIGSTNHLERLDPGISKRPSRFDRKYQYKIPGDKERVLYCEYWKKKLERNSNIDFDPAISQVVSKLTEGFSFAYMKELFVQTLLTIVGGREHELDEVDIEGAAESAKIIPESAKLAKEGEKIDSAADKNASTEKGAESIKTTDAAGELRKMPEVEIPEQLKNNPLMRILHKQAVSLWKDMDNSKDNEKDDKKDASKKKGGRRMPRFSRFTTGEAEATTVDQLNTDDFSDEGMDSD